MTTTDSSGGQAGDDTHLRPAVGGPSFPANVPGAGVSIPPPRHPGDTPINPVGYAQVSPPARRAAMLRLRASLGHEPSVAEHLRAVRAAQAAAPAPSVLRAVTR